MPNRTPTGTKQTSSSGAGAGAFSFFPRNCKAMMRCSPMQQRKRRLLPAFASLWKGGWCSSTDAGRPAVRLAERHGKGASGISAKESRGAPGAILVGISPSVSSAGSCSPLLVLGLLPPPLFSPCESRRVCCFGLLWIRSRASERLVCVCVLPLLFFGCFCFVAAAALL